MQNIEVSQAKRAKRKGGRPTLDSSAAIKERLLLAALDAFLADGYGGASISSIAASAKISRDTVYRHYDGKKALFLAAGQFAFEAMAEHLQSVIHLDEPPEVVLRNVIHYIHDDTRDPYSNSVIRLSLTEASRSPEIAADVLIQSYRFVEPLTRYLEYQDSLGQLQVSNPAQMALLIANMAAGGVYFYHIEGDRSSEQNVDAGVELLVQVLLYGMKGSMS